MTMKHSDKPLSPTLKLLMVLGESHEEANLWVATVATKLLIEMAKESSRSDRIDPISKPTGTAGNRDGQ